MFAGGREDGVPFLPPKMRRDRRDIDELGQLAPRGCGIISRDDLDILL
jgi:hypothetical protein